MCAKPFVCVALACASLSHAVRRDFKIDRPANLVEGVSVLIQKHAGLTGQQSAMQILQKAQKAVQGITPGAKEAMDEALRSVISEIEENVQSKIIRDHNETQTAINDALDSVTTTTNTAVDAKAAADTADNLFVECRALEVETLTDLEKAKEALRAAREAKREPCAEEVALAPYSKQFAEEDLVFDCDISDAGNCDGPLAAFETRVDGLLLDLANDVSTRTTEFQAAKGRCDAAQAAIDAAVVAKAKAADQFNTQKDKCMRDHESRQVSVCMFGMDLTGKCDSRSRFKELDAKIDGSGSVRSESDRISEWEATAVTRCMLNLIVESEDLANVNLNEQSLAQCTAAVKFAQDVGVLDRKREEFEALTTYCADTKIPFSGFTWNVPEGTEDTVVTSDDYKKVPFAVPVVSDGAKFAFCSVDAVTCGSFQCEFGKVQDRSRRCQLSSGCTSVECCEAQ